jgi:hypothetical protein
MCIVGFVRNPTWASSNSCTWDRGCNGGEPDIAKVWLDNRLKGTPMGTISGTPDLDYEESVLTMVTTSIEGRVGVE